jgi:hypothetical protein
MKIQPNAYWWISLAIGTYILGATGSWVFLYFLGAISLLQLGLTWYSLNRPWQRR